MKQKFGKLFVLIPIGLFFISGTLASLVTMRLPDALSGAFMGIGIGLASLPFLIRKVKTNNY